MSDHAAKRAFLAAFWVPFLPRYPQQANQYGHLLPEAFIERLPRRFSYADALPFLKDGGLCESCFVHAKKMIEERWDEFSASAALNTIQAVEDNGVGHHFNPGVVKLNSELRDFGKLRFDIADIIFLGLRAKIDGELEQLYVSVDESRPVRDTAINRDKILELFFELVRLRGDIDLSFLVILDISRTRKIMYLFEDRCREFYYNTLNRVRRLLLISTVWHLPDGNVLFGDEVLAEFKMNAESKIEEKLDDFKARCLLYLNDIGNRNPEGFLIATVRKQMEDLGMVQSGGGTTYNISGNTIGVFNAGTIKTIKSINQSVDKLNGEGNVSVANALAAITKHVSETKDDSLSADRDEILEQLGALSKLASEPKAETGGGVVKSLLRSLAVSLTASSLKDVWEEHGHVIAEFFGVG